MNPTGMNIVCFSCFFCACLCLCCLQLSFRALGIVWVSSHSFGVKIDTFFFWTPYSVRNVLTSFENCSQLARPVGIPDQPVEALVLETHWIVSISSHSSGLGIEHYFFFVGFLTL